jgi:hypothetical protein
LYKVLVLYELAVVNDAQNQVLKGIIALQKTKINPDRFSRPVRVNHLNIILLYYPDPYSIIEVYSDK